MTLGVPRHMDWGVIPINSSNTHWHSFLTLKIGNHIFELLPSRELDNLWLQCFTNDPVKLLSYMLICGSDNTK